uniref:Uncharacterized protein n=1 Tax=viral metagenome TaxID=1070528 RepID=A0A6M3Y5N3_9ZZZZ
MERLDWEILLRKIDKELTKKAALNGAYIEQLEEVKGYIEEILNKWFSK